MVVLSLNHPAEIDFFSGEKAKAFFREALDLPILSVDPAGPWTKVILGPDEIHGTTQVVCRMVDHQIDGILIEQCLIVGGKRVPGSGYPDIPGPTNFYCFGIRKHGLFYLYNYPLLRRATKNKRYATAVLGGAQAVMWEGENKAAISTAGIVVNPDILRSVMEDEAAAEQPIKAILSPAFFDDSLF